jgi:hypothetical protein
MQMESDSWKKEPNNYARTHSSFNFIKYLVTKHNNYITAREINVENCWSLDIFMQNKVKHP